MPDTASLLISLANLAVNAVEPYDHATRRKNAPTTSLEEAAWRLRETWDFLVKCLDMFQEYHRAGNTIDLKLLEQWQELQREHLKLCNTQKELEMTKKPSWLRQWFMSSEFPENRERIRDLDADTRNLFGRAEGLSQRSYLEISKKVTGEMTAEAAKESISAMASRSTTSFVSILNIEPNLDVFQLTMHLPKAERDESPNSPALTGPDPTSSTETVVTTPEPTTSESAPVTDPDPSAIAIQSSFESWWYTRTEEERNIVCDTTNVWREYLEQRIQSNV
ncbi:hypothetical protein C8J56DRAFT_1163790 [Mycena floridula]|nr:hypothetical protein C8J56DRAFT_1163790 [Mycena floridula]